MSDDIIERAESLISLSRWDSGHIVSRLVDALEAARAKNEQLQRTIDNWRSFSGY